MGVALGDDFPHHEAKSTTRLCSERGLYAEKFGEEPQVVSQETRRGVVLATGAAFCASKGVPMVVVNTRPPVSAHTAPALCSIHHSTTTNWARKRLGLPGERFGHHNKSLCTAKRLR
jgi:hypothetical protein